MDNKVEEESVELVQEQLKLAGLKQLISIVESIPAFARDRDETDWSTIQPSSDGLYNPTQLQQAQEHLEKLYYTNPSARGIIDTMVNFIVGKNAAIIPLDPDPKVAAYWSLFYEVNNMDLRIKELVKRTLLKGESFLRFFEPKSVDLSSSSTQYYNDIPLEYSVPLVRFVEPEEISDPDNTNSFGINTSIEDVEEILSYVRHKKEDKDPRAREVIPASQVIHTKILVDSNVKRGISFLIGIAEYIVKYQSWLEDRITLNRMRTLFNLVMKVTGVGSAQALKNSFEDASIQEPEHVAGCGIDSTASTANSTAKKLPKRGSVLLSTPNIEYEFLSPDIKATDTKEDGRAIDLMLSKGTGLTEYIIRGDASNANYASSMVSESPMVRMFQAYQDIFEKPLQQLYRKVIRFGIEKEYIPKKTEKTKVTIDSVKQTEVVTKEVTPTDHRCRTVFESLIHRDILNEAQAYAIHAVQGWDSIRGITAKVGNDFINVQKERRLEETLIKEQDDKKSEAAYNKVQDTIKEPNKTPSTGKP